MEKIKIEKEFGKYVLSSIYDNAKSFYNKAYFKEYIQKFKNQDGKTLKCTIYKIELYSYDTLVVTLNYNDIDGVNDDYFYSYTLNDEVEKEKLLSKTTLRHIKEFFKQKEVLNFIDNITKKDIIENNNKTYTHNFLKK